MSEAAPPKDGDAALKSAGKDKKAAKEAKRERRAAAQLVKGQDGGAGAPPAKHETQSSRARPAQTNAPSGRARRSSNVPEAQGASGVSANAASASQRPLDEDLSNIGVLGEASLFGNVTLPRTAHANAKSWCSSASKGNIHPSVVVLCQRLSTFALRGANKRAAAVLQALADVIRDYRTPDGAVLSRDLLTRVSQQVGHIVESRPMNTSTGHAVRFLKYEISVVDASLSEEEAKEHLLERIEHFVRDRIIYAARVIQSHAASKIRDGDVVMTYAHSSVVEDTLLAAHERGTRFEVVVIDSRPLFEGRVLADALIRAGIPTAYGLLSALSTLIPRVSLVLMGTASLLSNGAPYARAGTAMCAMMASQHHIPVIICCETYKFSDRIQLDSFVVNEAGAFARRSSSTHRRQCI